MCAHAFCCDKMHVRAFTPRSHEYVRGSLRKIMWWFFTILWLLVSNFIKIQGFNAEIFVKQYWLLRLINFQCILYIFTNIYLRNRQRWITTEWLWDLLETRYQNGPVLVKWKHHFKLIFCILTLINAGGGGAIILPCRKTAISPERNIRVTWDQSVNSSLSVVVH